MRRRSSGSGGPAVPGTSSRARRRRTPWWRRLDRILAWWLTPLASRQPVVRVLAWGAWAVFLLTLATWALLAWRSDVWLLPTVLAYGPRLYLLVPLGVVALVVALADRRLLLPMALGAAVLVGPVGGWRSGWRSFLPAPPRALRVMTLNAAGRVPFVPPAELLRTSDADLWVVEECADALYDVLRALPGRVVRRDYALCLVSRWPVAAVDSMERRDFERTRETGSQAAAYVVRWGVDAPIGRVNLVGVHLATARWGLSGFLPSVWRAQGTEGAVAQFRLNTLIRRLESERAADWAARQPSPVIVAGDFNLPVESTLHRDFWAPHFTDAFERAGRGFGFTKFERRIRIRIDRVLSDAALRPIRAVVGPDVGSDHRPVIVDLAKR